MEDVNAQGRNLEEIAAKGLGMESIETEEHMKLMWAGQSNVLVAVRVRPIMKHDIVKRSCVRVLDSKVVVILDPAGGDKADILRANRSREKQYAFDYVFEPGSSQDSVYHHTTKFLIHGVLDGFNATVFAYGQTGSGKTYSMIGTPTEPGIMVRVMADLFVHSASQGKQQGVHYKVSVSFLEVYNENIRDLLGQGGIEEYLDLREDPMKGPTVAGITEVEAKTSNEIMQLLQQGNAKRSQAATAANEASSRSHAVLQVIVESRDRAPGVVENIKVGKLSLVDLAGSERAANTKNTGVRLVEGANINRSLLALGNCINALGEKGNKGNFVPYRDSKLTRLLKDSLGGNCRTVMIANISACENSFEETLNTLKYANRAKNIKTEAKRNVLNVNYHISEYVQLINNLRGEIKILKEQIEGGPTGSPVSGLPPDSLAQEIRAKSRGIVGGFMGAVLDPNSGPFSQLAAGEARSPAHPLKGPSTPLHALRDSLRSGGGTRVGTSQQGETRELVNSMRQRIVSNFQERMQLRRSLIELEDQNVQNSIEVSKRQLLVVQWSEQSGVQTTEGSDFSSYLIANAPTEIVSVWRECEQLRKAVLKNNSVKRSIAKRLRHNEREAERFRDELGDKITGEDRRELMELQYQVGRLELENMELEQHRIVHDSILKGKDLTIQKLMLQLAVRDKVISRQNMVLREHQLEEEVGYSQLAIMEHSMIGDDGIGGPPPSPPRHLAGLGVTYGNGNPGATGRSSNQAHSTPQRGGRGIGHPRVPQLEMNSFSHSQSPLNSTRDDNNVSHSTPFTVTANSSISTSVMLGQGWDSSPVQAQQQPHRDHRDNHAGISASVNGNGNIGVKGKGQFSRRSPREYSYDGGQGPGTGGRVKLGPSGMAQQPHGNGSINVPGPKGGRVITQHRDESMDVQGVNPNQRQGKRASAPGTHSQSHSEIPMRNESDHAAHALPSWASADRLNVLKENDEHAHSNQSQSQGAPPPPVHKKTMSLQALRDREAAMKAAAVSPAAAVAPIVEDADLSVQGSNNGAPEAGLMRRPMAAPGQQRQRLRQASDGVGAVVTGLDLDEGSVDSMFSEGSDRSERGNRGGMKGRLLIPNGPSQLAAQIGVGGPNKSAALEKLKQRAPSFGMANPPAVLGSAIASQALAGPLGPAPASLLAVNHSNNAAALNNAAGMGYAVPGFQQDRSRRLPGAPPAGSGLAGQQMPAMGVGQGLNMGAVSSIGGLGGMRPTNRRQSGGQAQRPKLILKAPPAALPISNPDATRPGNPAPIVQGDNNLNGGARRSLPNLSGGPSGPNSVRRE